MKTKMLIIFLSMTSICMGQPTAEEIVRQSRDAVKVSSFESVSTLTTKDGNGNQRIRKSTMASKTFPDATEKRIIKFLAPAEVEGTGILIFDYEERSDDMWIFLPALRKTRRIVSREKSKSFMGSEFSNADMTAPLMEDFSYELIGKEQLNGTPCWKVTATARSMEIEDQYGYSRSVMWIGREDYIVRQTHFHDYSGKHFKTIINTDFKLIDPENNTYMITGMEARNHENGRSSVMQMEKVALAASKDEYFTISYLER